MVSNLLQSIDDKHQENCQLAIELEKIYKEINKAKGLKGENNGPTKFEADVDK